jgi:hypothetical protein
MLVRFYVDPHRAYERNDNDKRSENCRDDSAKERPVQQSCSTLKSRYISFQVRLGAIARQQTDDTGGSLALSSGSPTWPIVRLIDLYYNQAANMRVPKSPYGAN